MKINTGLFAFNLMSAPGFVKPVVEQIYGDGFSHDAPVDFELSLVHESFLRRFIRPQISFQCDQHIPFKPLPLAQAYPLLEWGMNWCIAAHDFYHTLIHSAVLGKNGKAVVFPAFPGSGKSTLTAYLALKGWQLFSDEMVIINPDDLKVNPIFRPVCLKNNSIDLIKNWFPDVIISPTCHDTQKGSVAHVKATSWDSYTEFEPLDVVAIVFPKYKAGSPTNIYQMTQAQAFEKLIVNAFNYNVQGKDGFNLFKKLIGKVALFDVEYSDLQDLEDFLDEEVLHP